MANNAAQLSSSNKKSAGSNSKGQFVQNSQQVFPNSFNPISKVLQLPKLSLTPKLNRKTSSKDKNHHIQSLHKKKQQQGGAFYKKLCSLQDDQIHRTNTEHSLSYVEIP